MKLYVTGGTGLVGSNFIRVATESHRARIFSAIHSYQPTPPVPYEYGVVDVRDRDRVFATVRAFDPDVIVHFAYMNDFREMYRDRRAAWESIVEGTRHLAEAGREVGATMILVSTDWVFNGTQGPADETTPPNPINYYGVMKVVGETLVTALSENGAVARLAAVFGVQWARPEWRPFQNAGFGFLPNAALERLRHDEPFPVWNGALNTRATPTLASDAARMIIRIIERDGRGIFHCCGGEHVTRLELARATAEVFGFDPALIRECPVDPNDPAGLHGIPVPADTSLDAARTAQALGHTLLSVREGLELFRSQLESGAIETV